MPRTVETYWTTRALRDLVRKAARLEGKSTSEFLRQAAEEKARAVIAARAREDLRAMLARLPPGRSADDAGAREWVRPWPGRHGATRGEDGRGGARDTEPHLGALGTDQQRCRSRSFLWATPKSPS